MKTCALCLLLTGCSWNDLFDLSLEGGSAPTGFDVALYGANSWGYTGTALAAGDLDGVPGDDLAVVTQSGGGGLLTGASVDVWSGRWSGAYALHRGAWAQVNGDALVSVATGDFTGDGQADLAIGAPDNGLGSKGEIDVLRGPIAAGSHALTFPAGRWKGDSGDRAGTALYPLGDWNGDGIDDLLVASRDNGSVVFALGPLDLTGDLSDFADAIVAPAGEDWGNGPAVATGDLDGDGSLDLALGAALAGKVYVFLHHPSGEVGAGDADWTLSGVASDPALVSSYLGSGVDIGDTDGDGVDDLVIGAPFTAGGLGEAFVFRGPIDQADTIADADLVIRGAPGEAIGAALGVAGDVDGDGDIELALADWNLIGGGTSRMWLTDAGGAGVIELASNGTEPIETTAGDGLAMYGGLVANRDFDADGAPDLAVGAPGGDGLSADSGSVYVRLGAP